MVAIAKRPKKLTNKDKTVAVKGRRLEVVSENEVTGKLGKKIKSTGIKRGAKKVSEKEKKKIANAFKLTEALGDKTSYVCSVATKHSSNSSEVLSKKGCNKKLRSKKKKEDAPGGEKKEKKATLKKKLIADTNEESEKPSKKLKGEDRRSSSAVPVVRKPRKKLWKPIYHGEVNLPSVLKSQVHQGVSALLKLEPENKKELLGDSEKPIYMTLTSIKIPLTPSRLIRFELPHPLRTSHSEVCLFVSDLVKGKKEDHEPTVEHVRELLKQKGVTILINEIVPIRQLKVEYDQFELKRSLCNRFDFFLSEAKVSGHILHLLGREFYRKKKVPVPVNLQAANLDKEISRALSKTALKVHSSGCSFIVQVAHTGQTQEEIEDNIVAAAESIARQFPGGWDNIRSLSIKTPLSLAVPVFMTLKSANDVPVPVVKPVRAKAAVPVTDELSTIPGAKVTVFPSGRVIIEGLDESDEEWKDPNFERMAQKGKKTCKMLRRREKNKWNFERQDKKREDEEDDDNDYGDDVDDNDDDVDDNEDESESESIDFSEKEEDEDDENVQHHWMKENETVKAEEKRKGKKESISKQRKKDVAIEDEDGTPSNSKKSAVSSSLKEEGNLDDDDDDNDSLKAEEDAYLSSWLHLKDVEEKEKAKTAKANQTKVKQKGKFQAKDSKKTFKRKGAARSPGKVQKKVAKKREKTRGHS